MPKRSTRGIGPLIAVVGPCASGKSLLAEKLRLAGHNAREVLQEHSYVITMWEQFTDPDLLIYLDVSWHIARQRRSIDAGPNWWGELSRRLRHAREHSDLYIHTDTIGPDEVFIKAVSFLRNINDDSRCEFEALKV